MSNRVNKQNLSLRPVVIQDDKTGEVLMVGYMNKEALVTSRKTGWVYFWSRKRQKLWMKGEKSGNKLKIEKIYTDCDNDTLLILVRLLGKYACHKQKRSCFYQSLY